MQLTDGNGNVRRDLQLGDVVTDSNRLQYTVRRIWDGQYTRSAALLSEPRRDMYGRTFYALNIHDGPFPYAYLCIGQDTDEAIDAAIATLDRCERAYAALGRAELESVESNH
jgi:hypothetical protein